MSLASTVVASRDLRRINAFGAQVFYMLMEGVDEFQSDSSVVVGRERSMDVHGGESHKDESHKSGTPCAAKGEHSTITSINSAQSKEFLRFWMCFMEERQLDSKV